MKKKQNLQKTHTRTAQHSKFYAWTLHNEQTQRYAIANKKQKKKLKPIYSLLIQ